MDECWTGGERVERGAEDIGGAEGGEHPVINLNVEGVGKILADLLCCERGALPCAQLWSVFHAELRINKERIYLAVEPRPTRTAEAARE